MMEILYPDRKMLKWQGFFLSEHQEAFWEESTLPLAFDLVEQIQEDISRDLQVAWEKHTPILIQLNERGTDGQLVSFQATVAGYSDRLIFIQVNNYVEIILIDTIRAVALLPERKWSQS